jgi:hypothetical protein
MRKEEMMLAVLLIKGLPNALKDEKAAKGDVEAGSEHQTSSEEEL